ncbi:MAG: AAA family ATPase, partial [Gammaproteobacteria bacterium]|nr:AAA family ATPase [Gammaproteobacteria bacterium]
MAKAKLQYQCRECGSLFPKWSGQCGECGQWNCLDEVLTGDTGKSTDQRFANYAGVSAITSAEDVTLQEEPRTTTHLSELDRVLGGGLVYGSVTLLGGDPGIGKSTLLLQCLANLSADNKTLYVTGEESLQQVILRARRLGLPEQHLRLLTETCVEKIIALANDEKPQIMVIDSIQTIYTDTLQSAPGSVSQVR